MPENERAYTEADVEAGARAIYEMTRGAFIPGVLRGIKVAHVGDSELARAVLDAVASRAASAPPDEDVIRADQTRRIVQPCQMRVSCCRASTSPRNASRTS